MSYRALFQQAWPLMLANIAQPLLGLVDTALIGHAGNATDLAALAVAVLITNFIFWNFGFLRMSTTALAARALGENTKHNPAFWQTILRACCMASILGLSIALLSQPIANIALAIMAPPESTLAGSASYLTVRLLGAPLSLMNFVAVGYFIARGQSKTLLGLQFLLNISNALFNIILVKGFGFGITGIALGTLMAEAVTLTATFVIVIGHFHNTAPSCTLKQITENLMNPAALTEQLKSNRDIWLRTLFLLMSFLAFTHWSGAFGATTLAANHILLQLIAFSAFFLDSYAQVTEAHIARAIGSKDSSRLKNILIKTSVLAAASALIIVGILGVFGNSTINLLTNTTEVINRTSELLPFALIYIALSWMAFQCDGIFIGANAGPALRNSSIAATCSFVGLWLVFLEPLQAKGLWLAFIGCVILRALFLIGYLLSSRFRRSYLLANN